VTEDLVTGSGPVIKSGDRVILHLQAYRADTGELLETTWEFDFPLDISLIEGATLDGLLEGIPGMNVGGRRLILIPFEKAFGTDGNPDLGQPGSTDLLVIIDIFAVIPTK
jgi:peptidylprolyl isomerase